MYCKVVYQPLLKTRDDADGSWSDGISQELAFSGSPTAVCFPHAHCTAKQPSVAGSSWYFSFHTVETIQLVVEFYLW